MESDQQEIDMWKVEIEAIRRRIHEYQGEKQQLTAFYGSSSIRLWNSIEEDLNPHSVINLGFGGSSYFWCQYYFEKVFQGFYPKQIILYAGDNDLGTGTSEDQIMENFSNLITKITHHTQKTQIATISVKPSPDRLHLREKIESLNKRMESFMDLKGGNFINVYPKMLDLNSAYRQELFTEDMLHMNEKGYKIWKREVGLYMSQC